MKSILWYKNGYKQKSQKNNYRKWIFFNQAH